MIGASETSSAQPSSQRQLLPLRQDIALESVFQHSL
jgi:hypothetical protein